MRDELVRLKAETAELSEVVDAVIADHQALIEKLNAAVQNQDWEEVSAVTSSMDATVEKLKSILPKTE